MFGYQLLMREVYSAHEKLKQEWADWQNGNLKKSKERKGNVEPESVTKARDEFYDKLNLLYSLRLEPLEQKFRGDPHAAFAELMEFLSVDIAAFRTGYAKEVFLRWLKNVDLSQNEIRETQRTALEICAKPNIRREFRYWRRLMIKFADADFLLELKKLTESDEPLTRLKSAQMCEAIEKHRTDLSEVK
jgi:hypothetical protein